MTATSAVRWRTPLAERPVRHRAVRPLRRRLVGPIAAAAAVLLVVVLLGAHLMASPYIEDDEATYVAQAQAVLHQAALAPYTYFYDHPPGGWIQLAGWMALTGDGAVGGPLADGRAFMVLVQAVSMLLVVGIGRRLTGSIWAGVAAALLFGLSPYGFFLHRRVLLDNIATVWMLAATALLMSRRPTLTRIALAAVAFGVAVWSKEIAVTLLPALSLLVVRRSPRESRAFALTGWFAVTGAVVSLYAVMALLKGELFPRGTPLGGAAPHVSLLCSLAWQSGRGSDGGLLQPGSGFWTSAVVWAATDPVLVVGGTGAAAAAVVLLLRRDAALSSLGIAVLCFWLFLGRGGITIGFYLVPLLPFLALTLIGVLWTTARSARRRWPARVGRVALPAALATAAALCALSLVATLSSPLAASRPSDGQEAAAAWVQQHLPSSSRIVMDMYLYPQLRDPASGAEQFPHAEYYWRAAEDPAVLRGVFHGRWQDVDYVVVSPQLLSDAKSQDLPLVRDALDHSVSVAAFDTGYRIDVRRVIADSSGTAFTWPAPRAGASASSCMSTS